MPRMRLASFSTSSIDLTTLTPPPLPRPPAWICAFTTQTGPGRDLAAATASSTVKAGLPFGTGLPNPRKTPRGTRLVFPAAPCILGVRAAAGGQSVGGVFPGGAARRWAAQAAGGGRGTASDPSSSWSPLGWGGAGVLLGAFAAIGAANAV